MNQPSEVSRPTVGAAMSGRQRFLAAARMQPVDVTPVWFMRQAGRSLPEYRELRQRYSFMKMATTPELAAMATLMPVDRLGVDAAVLFADIMLPLASLGVPFEIRPGVGPVIASPIRSETDVDRLIGLPPEVATPYVMEALRLVRAELGERAAVLGFAGAPFTLACYLIEGQPSREFPIAKALMYGNETLWHRLMEALTDVTIAYLNAQVSAGADAVQLFDSWLGLLDGKSYERFVLPYTQRIFAEVAPKVASIHFSTGTSTFLGQIARSGCSVVSVDWRISIDDAWSQFPPGVAIQGNLDPALLLSTWKAIEQAAKEVLVLAGGRPGHIFNLGHGIHPASDPDMLARLVQLVHAETGAEH